jgi:uncharacterized membrane protein YeaQ/YmgE (transglycosylase-associated protein family)
VNLLAWLIFGALAGWIAGLLYGSRPNQGCIANIVVGILGAYIGGFIGTRLFDVKVTGFNLSSMAIAVLGSLILLFGLSLIRNK